MLRPCAIAAVIAGAVASVALACTDEPTTTGTSSVVDAGASGDAEAPDDGAVDGDGDDDGGVEGAECAFNRDCKAALRCQCDEATGCACMPGARGTGRNGIDACDSGDQCASSLCVEGPTEGESICSDACHDKSDCTGKLPRCIDVAGIPEPICARTP